MSQQQGVSTKIGEREFTMYMLPPMLSHDLLIDVAKMVGPALGPVLDALFSRRSGEEVQEILTQELTPDFFTKAAKAIFEGLDKKIIRDVVNAFKGVTHVDGMPLEKTFDAIFLGELGAMDQWIIWGMKVQWSKSFSVLGNMVAVQGARMKAVG